ncbi:MAG: N-acetylmuramoyl-L-alanine amidase [Eubacterium sp.]|nr:N-acetylmuramoyl-L-alanine amidase [Eubacterium sp.]
MSINITKCTSTTNTTAKSGRSIKYIVLHYTAGTTSKSGTAKSVAQYFANSSVQASADFIVDDENIVQFNPDIANRYCWSVGGSKYSSPSTSLGASLITEAVKNILKDADYTYSSNIVAAICAVVVGILGTAISYVFLGIGFTAANIICITLMAVIIWVGAMLGYDKVTQLLEQIKNLGV